VEGLITALIDENPFEVPPAMVNAYLDAYVEDVKKQIKSDFDVEAFKEAQKPVAVRSIKWYLMKKKLAELENIQVADEEVDKFIENLAKASGQSERKLKAKYSLKKRRQQLIDDLLEEKIIDFLLEKSEIEEVELSNAQVEAVES
jgi:trigger factor